MPIQTPVYMGYVNNQANGSYDFSATYSNKVIDGDNNVITSNKGPGPGVYLCLITATTNDPIKNTKSTAISPSNINRNTYIYLLVVSSASFKQNSYNDYGVVVNLLYGKDTSYYNLNTSLNTSFFVTNVGPSGSVNSNTKIYVNVPQTDLNTYHMWYIKLF